MQQYQLVVFTAINLAGGALNSAAIDASNMYSISVQAITTTDPDSSTLKIQVSNDSPIGNKGFSSSVWTPTNWTDLPSATVTMTTAGTALIPKTDLCYQFIRLVYTPANTPTGTLTAQIKVMAL